MDKRNEIINAMVQELAELSENDLDTIIASLESIIEARGQGNKEK